MFAGCALVSRRKGPSSALKWGTMIYETTIITRIKLIRNRSDPGIIRYDCADKMIVCIDYTNETM